ncbi:hypothetical protein STEG23_018191, partial [Scotinomys teguina]
SECNRSKKDANSDEEESYPLTVLLSKVFDSVNISQQMTRFCQWTYLPLDTEICNDLVGVDLHHMDHTYIIIGMDLLMSCGQKKIGKGRGKEASILFQAYSEI